MRVKGRTCGTCFHFDCDASLRDKVEAAFCNDPTKIIRSARCAGHEKPWVRKDEDCDNWRGLNGAKQVG